jgi:hypothetical protein
MSLFKKTELKKQELATYSAIQSAIVRARAPSHAQRRIASVAVNSDPRCLSAVIEEQCLFEVLQEQCEKADAAGGELDGVALEVTQEMIDAKIQEKAANKTPQK